MMIRWAIGFLTVAIVAALVGFTGMAREAAEAARWVACVGLVMTGIALLRGPRRVTRPLAE